MFILKSSLKDSKTAPGQSRSLEMETSEMNYCYSCRFIICDKWKTCLQAWETGFERQNCIKASDELLLLLCATCRIICSKNFVGNELDYKDSQVPH